MFCPGCSAESPDGAKFCKSCGMNLTVVTQVLSTGPASVDPIKDREYKKARKKISDGIQGAAVGFALIAVAGLVYLFFPKERVWYGVSLIAALAGMIGFFRSVGNILDAKVGPKLLDSPLPARGTGPLTGPLKNPTGTGSIGNPSKRLPSEPIKDSGPREGQKMQSVGKPDRPIANPNSPQPLSAPRVGTGRVARESIGQDRLTSDDLFSKLRN